MSGQTTPRPEHVVKAEALRDAASNVHENFDAAPRLAAEVATHLRNRADWLDPPRPAEPTGLGAVVRDVKGRLFVRSRGFIANEPWWCAEEGERGWYSWPELTDNYSPLTVLSEGVTE